MNQWLPVALGGMVEEGRDPVNGTDCCPAGTLWRNTGTDSLWISFNNEACDCEWCEICAENVHTSHQAMVGPERHDYDDYDNNVENLPVIQTDGLNAQTVTFTNPSATRSMAVQIVWQGVNGGFTFADINGDWTAWYAIQPHFYLDAVQQNDHFRTDIDFYRVMDRGPAITQHSGTGGWTHSMVLGPGASVTASQDVTLLPVIIHNAPDQAAAQIESLPISIMGSTI